MRGRVTSFLYHRIGGDTGSFLDRGGPIITPDELTRDLRFLAEDLRATFFTFEDLRNGHFPSSEEVGVNICFDDCFADNYSVGVPLLAQFGVRATFFQVTSLIDSQTLLWEHELYWHTRNSRASELFQTIAHEMLPAAHAASIGEWVSLIREETPPSLFEALLARVREACGETDEMGNAARKLYPRREQILEAVRLGHEIGSHGHRHHKRVNIDAETFERELRESSEVLESLLGRKAGAFSYPFNSHLVGDGSICSRYFEQAITVDKRRIEKHHNPFWLPRFTWPGPARNELRHRRWLLTGEI